MIGNRTSGNACSLREEPKFTIKQQNDFRFFEHYAEGFSKCKSKTLFCEVG